MMSTPGVEAFQHVNHTVYYLDVAFVMPGCHDEVDGALGQLYHCGDAMKKFDWTSEWEERFRVPSLVSPSGAFQVGGAQCEAHSAQRHKRSVLPSSARGAQLERRYMQRGQAKK